MNAFTKLELAALHSIFSETPELAADLERQLERAVVVTRENTGSGFFTTIAVPADIQQLDAPRVLGYETQARVHGLEHGLGFVLFMKDGRMHLLESHTWDSKSTASLDLFDLTFEVFKQRIGRIG